MPNPPPGRPIWPSMAGQRDAGPDRLLAPVGALQRVAQRDHRPRGGHAAGERADLFRPRCRSAPPPIRRPSPRRPPSRRDRRRSGRSPRSSARGTRRSCSPSSISVWARPSISAVSALGRIGSQRAPSSATVSSRSGLIDTVSMPAAPSRAIQPRARCGPVPPKEICKFLGAMPPKLTISLVCRGDVAPLGRLHADRRGGADDVGRDDQRGAAAVIADGIGRPAVEVEQAADQGLRMVDLARARPSVAAGEDRLAAVRAPDAVELARDQLQRAIPRHRHEGLGAPARGVGFGAPRCGSPPAPSAGRCASGDRPSPAARHGAAPGPDRPPKAANRPRARPRPARRKPPNARRWGWLQPGRSCVRLPRPSLDTALARLLGMRGFSLGIQGFPHPE